MAEPALKLTSTSTARTYHFRPEKGFGWACCTVNDSTGELAIQSDWGSWSYRWSSDPKSLGAPTLTHFLSDRLGVDYIARKLQREGKDGRRFSPKLTLAAMRGAVLERRLEDGREPASGRHLSRERARAIWNELGEIAGDVGGSYDLFIDRVYQIRDFTRLVDDTPYEMAATEQTPEDKALREIVLPALIEACRDTVARWGTP
ncbi:MAG: hypothetical protein ACTHU0_16240 [Kofleriaceae bacterium]